MTEKLLKLTMTISEQLIRVGAEINRVEDCIDRIGKAYGAARVDVFATTSSIVVSFEDSAGNVYTHKTDKGYLHRHRAAGQVKFACA